MVYREYNYGVFKDKVKTLLRKRLSLREKVRYHKIKAKELKKQLPAIEKQIKDYLKRV